MENVEIKDVKKKATKKKAAKKVEKKADEGMNGVQKFMIHMNNQKAKYGHPMAYSEKEIAEAK